MKKYWSMLAIVTLIILTMALSLPIILGANPTRAGAPGEMPLIETLEALKLSESQKQSVALILKKEKDSMRNYIDGAREAHKNLIEAIQSTTFNEAAIRTAFKNAATGDAEIAVSRARLWRDVRALLTGDQLSILQSLRPQSDQERMDLNEYMIDSWINQYISR